ncbi:MAG: hypothetical protein OHK0022_38880 [Roseiflexaceae bacterium]
MDAANRSQSTVERCGVTMCVYNQAHQCTAGSITVALVDGMAHCATFTERDQASGIGSTEAHEHTTARSGEAE